MELPRLVRDKPGAWNPLICLKWGKDFIDFLTSIVTSRTPSENGVEPIWRIKFTPRSGVAATLLAEEDVEKVVNGEDRIGFLPRWYVDELTELQSLSRPSEAATSTFKPPPDTSKQKSTGTLPSGWQV